MELVTYPHDPEPGFGVLRIVSDGGRGTHVYVRVNDAGTFRDFELDDVVGVSWQHLDPNDLGEALVRAIAVAVDLSLRPGGGRGAAR